MKALAYLDNTQQMSRNKRTIGNVIIYNENGMNSY